MAQATVRLSCGVDEAANRCRDLMLKLGEERPAMQVEGFALEIVTPPMRRSFGTVIRAEMTDRSPGTDVTVSAWPGAQLVDWGESKRLLNGLVRDLKAQ
jgi:hypothetical protein